MNEISKILHLLINNLHTTVYNKKANIYLLNVERNIHYRLKQNKLVLFSFTSNYIKKWQSKKYIKIDCQPFSTFSNLVLYFISLLNSSFVIIIENHFFSLLIKEIVVNFNVYENFVNENLENFANKIIKSCKFQDYNFIDFLNISFPSFQPTMKISTLFFYNDSTSINEFRFNPSILHLTRDLFLCSYRYIKYDTDISTFPWTVWWDGTKFFRDKYPELVNKKKFFDFRFELPASLDEFEIDINKNQSNIDIQNIPEYDSTGIALLKYNKITRDFTIVYQNDTCFIKNIFSQDARLQKISINNNNLQIVITYNRFIIDQNTNKYRIVMCFRYINLFDTTIHFGREHEMLPNCNSPCEKNITFMPNNDILFSINDTFDIIPFNTNTLIKTNFPKINNTKQAYSQQIYFSLSTPAVLFRRESISQFIMVGHCKLPINIFTKYVDLSLIYKKNMNTVYTMFIVVFDNNYNILKSSPLFIPTSINNIHNPFLLTFPTGIYYDNEDGNGNDLIISYGEGDCKCKILHLTSSDLDQLFSIDENKTIFSVGYYFDSKFKTIFDHTSFTRLVYNKINIFGYYHHHNTGDDGFMIVFKQLFHKYNILLEFFNPDDSISVCDYLIVGGGNVVNSYFFDIVGYFREYHPSTPVFAVGVEIPFIQNTHFLSMVDYCFTRNESDLINIPLGNDKKQYMPDLLFALDTVYWNDQIDNYYKTFNIGVYLAQPYINKNYPTEGTLFINNIVEMLCQLYHKKFVGNKRIKIFLIPFGIDPNSETENDYIICNQVIDSCLYMGCDENFFTLVNINIHNNVHDTINQMKPMDFNICSRYHAHVFSIINNTIFVSLSTQKKCKNLMTEFSITDYIVDITVNNENVPISFNTNTVIDIFDNLFINNNNNNLVATLKSNMQSIYEIKKINVCDLFYSFFDPLIISPPDNSIGQGGGSHSNSCFNL